MSDANKPTVYCSGPMFSPADHWEQSQIATVLEQAGYPTYLPQRDGIEVGAVMGLLKKPFIRAIGMFVFHDVMQFIRKAGFALDMYNVLERCGPLVFNMNGRVPDDGSIVEAATAFTAGRPVVIYKNTPISELGGYDNPMVSGLSTTWECVGDFTKIPAAVDRAIQTTPPSPYQGDAIPSQLRKLIAFGKKVAFWVHLLHQISHDAKPEERFDAHQKFVSVLKQTDEFKAVFPSADSASGGA
jgi:nucleoside 2-deoxyribosyltransferase